MLSVPLLQEQRSATAGLCRDFGAVASGDEVVEALGRAGGQNVGGLEVVFPALLIVPDSEHVGGDQGPDAPVDELLDGAELLQLGQLHGQLPGVVSAERLDVGGSGVGPEEGYDRHEFLERFAERVDDAGGFERDGQGELAAEGVERLAGDGQEAVVVPFGQTSVDPGVGLGEDALGEATGALVHLGGAVFAKVQETIGASKKFPKVILADW